MLLGAAVAVGQGTLLDLGAGVGTAALVALVHRPGLGSVLVEADAEMLGLAVGNIAQNGFAERATTIQLDVTAPGAARVAAGLKSDHYAGVIANPPFFVAGQGTLAKGDARAAARHMDAGTLDLWVKTAAAAAAPEGEVIFILPAESLPPLLAAFDARFGALTLLPLSPRQNAPASRVLIRGLKGSRAPMTLLATRALHESDGRAFTADIEAVLRGEAPLLW
ncbi:MAG TPA: methyltransferase [Devosiaceae bacterium]|nr:methyltransferase [Devosiaceae bacterium]